jgi:hypothetical protein
MIIHSDERLDENVIKVEFGGLTVPCDAVMELDVFA